MNRCHPWTGVCECKAGWAGETCTRACPFYKYGEKCIKMCECKNGAFCDPVDGSCTCAPGKLLLCFICTKNLISFYKLKIGCFEMNYDVY